MGVGGGALGGVVWSWGGCENLVLGGSVALVQSNVGGEWSERPGDTDRASLNHGPGQSKALYSVLILFLGGVGVVLKCGCYWVVVQSWWAL